MTRSRRVRIARLEDGLSRYLAALDDEDNPSERTAREDQAFRCVFARATNLAFLIHIGSPTLGEPLSAAWARTGFKGSASPFDNRYFPDPSPEKVAREIHASTIPGLPDLREKENLDKIFASAPAWLIWFAYGDFTCGALGLKMPDLSSVVMLVRDGTTLAHYPSLPSGAFECIRNAKWKATMRTISRRERKRALKFSVTSDVISSPASRVKWPLNIDEPWLEPRSEQSSY